MVTYQEQSLNFVGRLVYLHTDWTI